MQDFQNSVLISGASSGIGAEIARKFSSEKYFVILLGRDEEKLKAVQSSLQGPSEFLAFDLKNLSQTKPKLQACFEKTPALSVLVNNAGLYHNEAFESTTDEIWLEQFQVNLLSAVQLTKLVWPSFKKQKHSCVINIASTLGVRPAPNNSAYSAIKAAMINWTLSLAQEGGPFQIRANCICPGLVDTPIHAFHQLPREQKNKVLSQLTQLQLLNEIGQPQDVAEATYFLASAKSKWTTGSIFHIDGGIGLKS